MTIHPSALGNGARRGLIEFRNSLRTPSELGFYLVSLISLVAVVFFTRDGQYGAYPLVILVIPGILAVQVIMGATYGLATLLATEREDGTLLRAKSLPNGMSGYVTGHVSRTGLEAVFTLGLSLVAASIFVPVIWTKGPIAVIALVGFLLLGLLAAVPLGIAIGSIFRSPRALGGWGFVVVAALAAISGLFYPLGAMPWPLQVLGQVFPMYWLGLGLRSSVMPDAAVALEIGESWRTLETLAVLGVWAIIGLLLAPVLLRRVARRESGSSMEARRQSALQRV